MKTVNTVGAKKRLGVLLFPDFELLDVAGPLEMLGQLQAHLDIILVSQSLKAVSSAQGITIQVNTHFSAELSLDYLLIPGGIGTRYEINNQTLLSWIEYQVLRVDAIMTVCTGAALLAKTGALDGRAATTNKKAFAWVKSQGPQVRWQEKARWVEDHHIFTSSGVAAGIDMSLSFIAKYYGEKLAEQIAQQTEYIWNKNCQFDPFSINMSASS